MKVIFCLSFTWNPDWFISKIAFIMELCDSYPTLNKIRKCLTSWWPSSGPLHCSIFQELHPVFFLHNHAPWFCVPVLTCCSIVFTCFVSICAQTAFTPSQLHFPSHYPILLVCSSFTWFLMDYPCLLFPPLFFHRFLQWFSDPVWMFIQENKSHWMNQGLFRDHVWDDSEARVFGKRCEGILHWRKMLERMTKWLFLYNLSISSKVSSKDSDVAQV